MKKYLHICGSLKPGGITSFVKSIISLNEEECSKHYAAVFKGSLNSNFYFDISKCKINPSAAFKFALYSSKNYEKIFIHSAGYLLTLCFILIKGNFFLFQHGMAVGNGSSLKRFLKRKWFSIIPYLLNAKIICSTEFAFKKTLSQGVKLKKNRVRIIPFGINLPRKVEPKRNSQKNKLIIGTAGRLAKIKRFSLLLNSLANYKNDLEIELKIAGDGPEKEKLIYTAEKINNSKIKISFLGNIDKVTEFYDEIDLFVFTSHNESFGLVIIEAFFRNTPVAVFNDLGGALSLIHNMKNGFVLQSIDNDLQKLFALLNKSPEILKEMSYYISKSDYSLYDIRNTRKKLEEIN